MRAEVSCHEVSIIQACATYQSRSMKIATQESFPPCWLSLSGLPTHTSQLNRTLLSPCL